MEFAGFGGQSVKDLAEWVDWLPNHNEVSLGSKPDVLILAARYGDGHLRAAKAVALQMMLQAPTLKLGILDYYRFVSPRLDDSIRWAYLSSVRFVPGLWRWFYTATQKIDPNSSAQQFLNRIGMERFYEAIRLSPPKVIVSTYPTAAGVVSTLKETGRLDVANYVVMTDYSVHSQWIHPGVDAYFVGSEDMRDELLDRGIAASKIVVSGIPVDERFKQPIDEERVRRDLGLDERPVILFMGGSYMPLKEYTRVLEAIDTCGSPHIALVVAGRDPARREIAERHSQTARNPVRVFGYVDNIHELMAVSALLVSKAGGLTTTESLCLGVPTLIYRPIPGQEDANAEFLVRHGAGRWAAKESEVGPIVSHLLEHPWELKAMARQARQLGHPEASETIAKMVHEALFRRHANAPA